MSRARCCSLLAPVIAVSIAVAVAAVFRIGLAAPARGYPIRVAATSPVPRMVTAHWITSWGGAPQGPSGEDPLSEHGFRNVTLRQIVFTTAPGSELRVRFTNVFGSRPLRIGLASVAVQSNGAALRRETVRELRFAGGRTSVSVPAGGTVTTDPVSLEVPPLTHLAISVYLPHPTGPATGHIDSREFSYERRGLHPLASSAAGFRTRLGNWYFLDSVQSLAPARYEGSLVALGDSITAGVGSSRGGEASWPGRLAARLTQSAGAHGPGLAVVDEGIGGNRVLNDSPCCGISAVARFRPDVEDLPGAKEVILLEGVNDLGFSQKRDSLSAPHTEVSVSQVIAGYEQIIDQAHRAGMRIIGGTITPFRGSRNWTADAERKREAINRWILRSGAFDGVIDFAAAVAAPGHPERLNPAYDYGDHLHLNDAGYRAMADVVDLRLLEPVTMAPADGARHRQRDRTVSRWPGRGADRVPDASWAAG